MANVDEKADVPYETGRVLKEFRCLSCDHTWFQRKHGEVSRQCPHCKSARWQIGKVPGRGENKAPTGEA